jgi:hypothetical protein
VAVHVESVQPDVRGDYYDDMLALGECEGVVGSIKFQVIVYSVPSRCFPGWVRWICWSDCLQEHQYIWWVEFLVIQSRELCIAIGGCEIVDISISIVQIGRNSRSVEDQLHSYLLLRTVVVVHFFKLL